MNEPTPGISPYASEGNGTLHIFWLPVEFRHGVPMIAWHAEWDLSYFDTGSS